jgi:hypothetical protein
MICNLLLLESMQAYLYQSLSLPASHSNFNKRQANTLQSIQILRSLRHSSLPLAVAALCGEGMFSQNPASIVNETIATIIALTPLEERPWYISVSVKTGLVIIGNPLLVYSVNLSHCANNQ